MKQHISILKSILILLVIDKVLCQKYCDDYKDSKTGITGTCMDSEQCCSGATIDNICPYPNICCFGYDKCEVNENNNNIVKGCSRSEIITRMEWGAHRPIKFIPNIHRNIEHIFIHHTDDGESCYSSDACMRRVRSIQSYHQNNKHWPDIGYNFLIGGDGLVYEGRGWSREGSHTLGWNSLAIGIAFIGEFDVEEPNDDMINAAKYLISCGVEKGYLNYNYKLHGHRDARCTSCPGEALYDIISDWQGFRGGKLSIYHC